MATHKSSKTFFFMCSGTKKASIFFSPCLEASASGNKKYHTEKHQIGVSLRVREQKGSHTRASFFFSASGNKKDHTQEQQKFFSMCLGTKNGINFFLRVREQKGSHTRASIFFSTSGNKKDHTQEAAKDFSDIVFFKNFIKK